MISYVVRRILIGIPTLLALVVFSYLIIVAAPGSPFVGERTLPPEVLANLEARYGLDQPLLQQILNYVWGIVTEFDFGPSFVYKDRTVADIIAQGVSDHAHVRVPGVSGQCDGRRDPRHHRGRSAEFLV